MALSRDRRGVGDQGRGVQVAEKLEDGMEQRVSKVTTDPRVLRTQEALRAAILGLLESTALEQITIADITAAAGVGKTTFFRHYASKEALLDDIAAEQIRRLVGLTLPIFEAHDLRASAVALFAYVDAHRPLWTALLTGGAAAAIAEAYTRESLAIAAAKQAPSGWLPADCGVALVVSGTIGLLAWWLGQEQPLPIRRVADIYAKLVVGPVLEARPPRTP